MQPYPVNQRSSSCAQNLPVFSFGARLDAQDPCRAVQTTRGLRRFPRNRAPNATASISLTVRAPLGSPLSFIHDSIPCCGSWSRRRPSEARLPTVVDEHQRTTHETHDAFQRTASHGNDVEPKTSQTSPEHDDWTNSEGTRCIQVHPGPGPTRDPVR